MSEMRLLRKIYCLPKPRERERERERVVGQPNAVGKINSLLSYGVLGVCFLLVYAPTA